jgi:hypothetical protein
MVARIYNLESAMTGPVKITSKKELEAFRAYYYRKGVPVTSKKATDENGDFSHWVLKVKSK